MKQLKKLAMFIIASLFAIMANAQTAAAANAAASAQASAVAPAASAPAQAASASASASAKADAKCDCKEKAVKPVAKKPAKAAAKVEKTSVDPLPGRLLTVSCDGTIHSAPIPTHETRVELVGNCTPAVMARAQTVVEDHRVVSQAPAPVVAQASAQASVATSATTASATAAATVGPAVGKLTFKAFCEAKFNNGVASEYVLADDASDAAIRRACDGWAQRQLASRNMSKPLNGVPNGGKSIYTN